MSAIGLHRVVSPARVSPQAAERLDASPSIGADEVRIRVERLNLDAASYRQLRSEHAELALDLVRTDPGVRMLFDARLAAD